ncbi:MAG: SPX domain protein involved in polyphosphate accumulation [Parasphingorhabdus sp.]|jgi:SPX domain protein involved in polyphosphate accumulation
MIEALKTTQVEKSPLHFARLEFKYLLPAAKRKQVEKDLQYFLEFDPFVADREEHRYIVRSLYYDDLRYSAFHDKIDGLHTRSKFRLRTYTKSPQEPAPLFLEIKGRHNNLVFKHRAPVNRLGFDWGILSDQSLTKALLENTAASKVRDQFTFQLFRKNLRPVALIDYQRRPYISKYDPGFRITFDEQLLATRTRCLFPGPELQPRQVVAGYTVLEVKFRHHMPSWFHQVLQSHELRRISISKIVSGMEVLGLAKDEQ